MTYYIFIPVTHLKKEDVQETFLFEGPTEQNYSKLSKTFLKLVLI